MNAQEIAKLTDNELVLEIAKLLPDSIEIEWMLDSLQDRLDSVTQAVSEAKDAAHSWEYQFNDAQDTIKTLQGRIDEAHDLLRQFLGPWDGISVYHWPDHLIRLAPIIKLLEE